MDEEQAFGYPLSIGQTIRNGTFAYWANLVNAYTYADMFVTFEPRDDPDPNTAYSQTLGVSPLNPSFGKVTKKLISTLFYENFFDI
jgi:hypothetical protein